MYTCASWEYANWDGLDDLILASILNGGCIGDGGIGNTDDANKRGCNRSDDQGIPVLARSLSGLIGQFEIDDLMRTKDHIDRTIAIATAILSYKDNSLLAPGQ